MGTDVIIAVAATLMVGFALATLVLLVDFFRSMGLTTQQILERVDRVD